MAEDSLNAISKAAKCFAESIQSGMLCDTRHCWEIHLSDEYQNIGMTGTFKRMIRNAIEKRYSTDTTEVKVYEREDKFLLVWVPKTK